VTNFDEEQEDELPSQYADVSSLPDEVPQQKRGFLGFRQGQNEQERLEELNVMITLYPDTASNFVLRGELFEKQKQLELASADYETAQQLASEQVTQDRWGLVNQAVQDRAIRGLRRVKNRE
jgi:hypothetical protein